MRKNLRQATSDKRQENYENLIFFVKPLTPVFSLFSFFFLIISSTPCIKFLFISLENNNIYLKRYQPVYFVCFITHKLNTGFSLVKKAYSECLQNSIRSKQRNNLVQDGCFFKIFKFCNMQKRSFI